MAGDWIKMRVLLPKHPKVITIADFLAYQRPFMDWMTDPVHRTCDESVYEYVTRNVTVSVTVTALLQVWGVCNDVGKAVGDDLVVQYSGIETIDEIAGVPCFGLGMEHVGWAIAKPKGFITLPGFLTYNVPFEDRYKEKNRERQRRHREKLSQKRNVTGDVMHNVTDNAKSNDREEKRRVDIELKESTPLVQQTGKKQVPITSADVTIPNSLDTPAVRLALYDWLEHHKQIGKPYRSLRFVDALFEPYLNSGPASFVAAVKFSIANCYTGLFQEKQNGKPGSTPGPGQRFLPGQELGPV